MTLLCVRIGREVEVTEHEGGCSVELGTGFALRLTAVEMDIIRVSVLRSGGARALDRTWMVAPGCASLPDEGRLAPKWVRTPTPPCYDAQPSVAGTSSCRTHPSTPSPSDSQAKGVDQGFRDAAHNVRADRRPSPDLDGRPARDRLPRAGRAARPHVRLARRGDGRVAQARAGPSDRVVLLRLEW